jgi:hypothetical protein
MKPDPQSSRTPLNQMLNITNTCLYQARTKFTNITSQDMCLNHVPNLYQIMDQSCTKTCTKHVPYHVPNLCQIMHQPKPMPCHVPTPYHASNMYLIMHQCHQGMPHTYTKNVSQTMCQISKMFIKPCASTIYHITHDMS